MSYAGFVSLIAHYERAGWIFLALLVTYLICLTIDPEDV